MDNSNNDPVISSIPPFQTKEPDRYQATRTITTVAPTGETVISRQWFAKDGVMRRHEFERGGSRGVYLSLAEGKFLLLSPAEKLYAELSRDDNNETGTTDDDVPSSPDRLLHTEPITTSYEKLGSDTIAGRSVQKYRVVVNSSSNANVSVSETLMWVDDALHMPIKSETKSPDGTRVVMELSNIQLQVDKRFFQVPDDYERIAFPELRKRLQPSQP